MLFHSGVIRGGFLGVDIFFVLSGFLITSLLLAEQIATGSIGIRRFYLRRALRLLPAVVVFLVVWGVVLLATIPQQFWARVASIVCAVLFYFANWVRIYGMPLGIFGHAWSLAVEEQFYLVWPIIFSAVVRRVPRPIRAAGLLAVVAALTLAWRLTLALAGGSQYRIYCGTDTHADGLLLGAALAFLIASGKIAPVAAARKIRWLATAVSSAGLFGLLLTAREIPGYAYGVSTLIACATAIVIADVVTPGSCSARFFQMRGVAGVGRISYGLYLWHYPVFFYIGVLTPYGGAVSLLQGALAWAVTLAAALASYFVVERPFLAYKDRFAWSRRIRESRSEAGRNGIWAMASEGNRDVTSVSNPGFSLESASLGLGSRE